MRRSIPEELIEKLFSDNTSDEERALMMGFKRGQCTHCGKMHCAEHPEAVVPQKRPAKR